MAKVTSGYKAFSPGGGIGRRAETQSLNEALNNL